MPVLYLLRTFFGVLINVSLTVMLAYPISRSTFYGRSIIMVILIITMMFSGGLIPYYLTVKNVGISIRDGQCCCLVRWPSGR